MAKDFFGNLGQALSKTAKELSGRAEDVYETQRLKNKISAEERQIDKIMADLGKIVYQRYKEEVPVDDAQKALCEQIDQRMEQIEQLRADINELKIRTRRICPSCGKEVEKNAAFCKFCGAACPTQEEEEDAGDTIDGTAEEVEEEKKSEESAEEAAETEAETEAADIAEATEEPTADEAGEEVAGAEPEEKADEAAEEITEEVKIEEYTELTTRYKCADKNGQMGKNSHLSVLSTGNLRLCNR